MSATSSPSALMTAPGTRQNASQIESRRPSSWAAPSIWKAAVAAPNRKSWGKARGIAVVMRSMILSGNVGVRMPKAVGNGKGLALDGAGHDAADQLPAREGEDDE